MRLFRPDTPWFRLTTLDQRERLFARAGADAMLVFDFTRELAALDPRAFVDLLARWGVAGVVTGEDFTFRSEEHTSELQSLMRNSYAVFCLKKKNRKKILSRTTKTT